MRNGSNVDVVSGGLQFASLTDFLSPWYPGRGGGEIQKDREERGLPAQDLNVVELRLLLIVAWVVRSVQRMGASCSNKQTQARRTKLRS